MCSWFGATAHIALCSYCEHFRHQHANNGWHKFRLPSVETSSSPVGEALEPDDLRTLTPEGDNVRGRGGQPAMQGHAARLSLHWPAVEFAPRRAPQLTC